MNKQIADRAVVLGGSLAGLLAARVLADAYAQVTVIDRDELPEAHMHRRGVPQGRHVHGLLARGQQGLEELFPGLTAELIVHGVPAGDVLANVRLYLSGHRLRQAHTGLVVLSASRPVLEGHVRARVHLGRAAIGRGQRPEGETRFGVIPAPSGHPARAEHPVWIDEAGHIIHAPASQATGVRVNDVRMPAAAATCRGPAGTVAGRTSVSSVTGSAATGRGRPGPLLSG